MLTKPPAASSEARSKLYSSIATFVQTELAVVFAGRLTSTNAPC